MRFEDVKTMADAREFSQETGHHFFDRKTMKFFNSRIESALRKDKTFTTSECLPGSNKRKYTIRQLCENGDVKNCTEFMKMPYK